MKSNLVHLQHSYILLSLYQVTIVKIDETLLRWGGGICSSLLERGMPFVPVDVTECGEGAYMFLTTTFYFP